MHTIAFLLLGLVFFLGPMSSHALVSPVSEEVEHYLRLGSEQQEQGLYLPALSSYQAAMQRAENTQNATDLAFSQTALGYITYLLNRPAEAKTLLEQALALSSKASDPSLPALAHYYLALAEQQLQHTTVAQAQLDSALQFANAIADAELLARIHLAQAQLSDTPQRMHSEQQAALTHMALLEPRVAGKLQLQLAEQLLQQPILPALTPQNAQDYQRLSRLYQALMAAKASLSLQPVYWQAKYHQLLGQTYETQQRYAEALVLTQQAMHLLQQQAADDLLLFCEWQSARLHRAMQHNTLAIASYRRAIAHVQSMRQDIPVLYHDGQSSFLQLFGPLYRGLVELLLQQENQASDKAIQQALLQEVGTLMDKLKQTELEDFFHDRCLITGSVESNLLQQSTHVAVLYPILLPDKLVLLLHNGKQYQQFATPTDTQQLSQKIRRYARHLRHGIPDNSNRQLYDVFIRPLRAALAEQQIDTLIYIPDGALRLLPLAALHDGTHYLIEDYAIATLPGLGILSTQLSPVADSQSLLVGLSHPSSASVEELPKSLLKSILQQPSVQASERGLDLAAGTHLRSVSAQLRGLSETDASRGYEPQKVAQALALPGVEAELQALAQQMPNLTLLNQQYTLDNFQQQAQQSVYDIVHIASHGYFGGDSAQSFIMTYDKLLTINHLEQLLIQRQRNQPLDLLVLSACQTAEGDDRAPLGLSGVALKANARSALGSLWPISDTAAVAVMQHFYQGLGQALSKAKALQQAQIALIHSEDLSNPFYWAAFTLVGQWL